MIPEIGFLSLWIASCLSSLLALGAIMSLVKGENLLEGRVYASFAFVIFACICVSFGALVWSFLNNDFSLLYVANNSNSALPTIYKISGVWGGHEGSMLLWLLILGFWSFFFACFENKNQPIYATSLAILFLLIGLLGLFTVITSNPFERQFAAIPADGRDLNPLLQDIGMAFHPPLLYVGYVGTSVAFAISLAAIMLTSRSLEVASIMKKYAAYSWAFLSFGILLGSWWAYYELGWGGWWFWDPVENASFMPWLLSAALVHTLIVVQKRGIFSFWAYFLAIATFCLTLIGTFLVRSGILVSVHAFASDPERGKFLLFALFGILIASMAIFIYRYPDLVRQNARVQKFSLYMNKEMYFLINNALLLISCLIIFLGTLYPTIVEIATGTRISVGPPFFEKTFTPVFFAICFFAALGPITAWFQARRKKLQEFVPSLVVCLAVPLLFFLFSPFAFNFVVAITLILTSWLVFHSCQLAISRWKQNSEIPLGSFLGHIGLASLVFGAVLTSNYTTSLDTLIKQGETVSFQGHNFTLSASYEKQIHNYVSQFAEFDVTGATHTKLLGEKRFYPVREQLMTEAAIYPSLLKDIYISLGEKRGAESWNIRIQIKPFVRFVWLGMLLIGIGALFQAKNRRQGSRFEFLWLRLKEKTKKESLSTQSSPV